MEWIVSFVAAWVLFIFLVDLKKLKVNVWCGILSILLQMAIDIVYIHHGYYKITNPVISVFGSSIFYMFGPVLAIGILLAQFHPSKRWMQILYVIALSVFGDFQEHLLTIRHALVYLNWSFAASAVINLIIMITLSWFTVVVLKRGEAIK
jgi:hypothetical protein